MNRNKKINFNNFDAVYISSPSNLFYFSGYTNEDARIILTRDKQFYISDKRVKEEFEQQVSNFIFIEIQGGGSYSSSAIQLLKELNIKHLAYEDMKVLQKEYLLIKKFKLIPLSEQLSKIRSIKEKDEVDLIIKAQSITDNVFYNSLSFIKPGISEKQLCNYINSQIFINGGTLAFDTIVAFGKNTSKPHAHPSDNVLLNDDYITMDFGAKYQGYCSDMTRSLAIGNPSEAYIETYNLVLEAQNTAIESIKPGMTGLQCDSFARMVFTKNNLSEFFTHSLGHSLGIDIHEYPMLSKYYDGEISEGVVTSIEPGIYLPGKFGIRIEDIVIVARDKVVNLTKSQKTLIIL